MFSAIDNIQSLIGISNYLITLTLDLDDPTMNNEEIKGRLKKYDNLIVYWGLSRSKIEAINRSIPMNVSWRYLLVTSDDMVYIKKDFGKDIIEEFEKDKGIGLLHVPDQHVNEKLITLPLMTREYYELFGYVYNPEYDSVKADGEQMEVAQRLGKYKYRPINIVRHEHYRWGYGQKDELNKKQDCPEKYIKDGQTFQRRKMMNFGL
jgi:hypothetical protein